MDQVAQTFPQINLIKDFDLRGGVERCWEEAVRRGGWKWEDLEVIPFTLQMPIQGISLATHTRCVTDCALSIWENLKRYYQDRIPINEDILVAGALLHDVGKCLEFCRDGNENYLVSPQGHFLRHPISGAALAAEMKLPQEVQHIIALHSWEGERAQRSPAAWIVHFADFANFETLKPLK